MYMKTYVYTHKLFWEFIDMSISQIKPNFTVSKVNKNVSVFKKFSIFRNHKNSPKIDISYIPITE